MPYLNKKAILDSLTKEDVIKICVSLGSQDYKTGSSGELIFQSICHGSDSWKLYYYHDAIEDYPEKIFHCYSGCGDSFSIFELVIRANRCKGHTVTFYQALNYVAALTNNIVYLASGDLIVKNDLVNDWDIIKKFKQKRNKELPQLKERNEHILEMFDYTPHEVFLNDHISRETLSEFEISYWGLTNQIVIPHRDKQGRLIGVRGRFLDQVDIDAVGKYVPLEVEGEFLSHSLGSNLYGIHINQNKIKQCKKVLLVESEKGVMQNHTYFGANDFSLAVCGSNITSTQIKLLLQYLKVEEVIIGFDKEFLDPESYQADIYRNKLLKKVTPLLPYCKVCFLWDKSGVLGHKDAPTDRGKDTLLKLLDEKIEITIEDLELLNEGW